jgi:chromosome segregation ATPase
MLDEIHRKQKEYDEFDAKYNLSKETIQKLEKETKEFSIKRDNLLAEIRKFEAVRNEIQDKILQLKREEESLTVSLSTRQQISEELEKKKLDFDESHLKIENNLALILQKFIEELNSSKDKLSSLRQQIIDKEKELNEKEKILLEKTSQVAEYSGMTKVMLKERSATEQQVSGLKEERDGLSSELFILKNEINKQKIQLQQLGSETKLFETKKETLEKEIRGILQVSENNFSALTTDKQKITLEIVANTHQIEELKNKIDYLKTELRNLKNEIAEVETQKEGYTAKVSELIAMEKNLKHRISENEKKLVNTQSKK